MTPHTAHRTIFTAPFGAILAGLIGDVQRYERDKRLCGVNPIAGPRCPGSSQSVKAEALQLKILDVLKAAPLVLEVIARRRMDSGAVTIAINGKRSAVYESLHRMIDSGQVVEIDVGKLRGQGQRCIEFSAA